MRVPISEDKIEHLEKIVVSVLRKLDDQTGQSMIDSADAFQDCIVSAINSLTQQLTSAFPVVVDYGRSLKEMVAAGNYGYVHRDIVLENFPVKEKGRKIIEIVLIKFDQKVSSENVIKYMDQKGFRPATLPELLALGEKEENLDLLKNGGVVAFGSMYHLSSGYRVAFLDWRFKNRLRTIRAERVWEKFYSFAAVRK